LNTFNIHDGKIENVQNLDDEDDHLENLPQTTFEPDADGGANENVEP